MLKEKLVRAHFLVIWGTSNFARNLKQRHSNLQRKLRLHLEHLCCWWLTCFERFCFMFLISLSGATLSFILKSYSDHCGTFLFNRWSLWNQSKHAETFLTEVHLNIFGKPLPITWICFIKNILSGGIQKSELKKYYFLNRWPHYLSSINK